MPRWLTAVLVLLGLGVVIAVAVARLTARGKR